jgi:hypothetical protein
MPHDLSLRGALFAPKQSPDYSEIALLRSQWQPATDFAKALGIEQQFSLWLWSNQISPESLPLDCQIQRFGLDLAIQAEQNENCCLQSGPIDKSVGMG